SALRRKLDAVSHSFSLRLPSRLRLEPETAPRPRVNTPVTVGVLTSDAGGRACRKCLDGVKAHSPDVELIVLDRQPGDRRLPRELNRLLAAARTDHVVLMQDHVQV